VTEPVRRLVWSERS